MQLLEERGFTPVDAAGGDPTDGVIAYEIETDAVYVQQTTVSVTLTR